MGSLMPAHGYNREWAFAPGIVEEAKPMMKITNAFTKTNQNHSKSNPGAQGVPFGASVDPSTINW